MNLSAIVIELKKIASRLSNLVINISGDQKDYICKVSLNTQQDNLTDNTYIKVNFDAKIYDPLNLFDLSSKKLTIEKAGFYQINASARFTNVIADKKYNCIVYVNGVASGSIGEITCSVINVYPTVNISDVLYLNKGDYLELFVRSSAGVSTVDLIAGGSFLSISRLNSYISPTPTQTDQKFSYSRSTNQSIADATSTKVQLNVKNFDPENCFDSSNYRFISKESGFYYVSAFLSISTNNNAMYSSSGIKKNGVDELLGSQYYSNYGITSSISGLVYLEKGDYLELFCYQDNASNVANNLTLAKLMIHKLSD